MFGVLDMQQLRKVDISGAELGRCRWVIELKQPFLPKICLCKGLTSRLYLTGRKALTETSTALLRRERA